MIPVYRLWLHSLYRPRCLLSPERLLNLITHSLTKCDTKQHKKVRKIAFTIKNEIEVEGLSRPKSKWILTVQRCISGPKFGDSSLNGWQVIVWTSSKFEFQAKFDLEGQGRSSPKITGILTKVFCISVPILVILA